MRINRIRFLLGAAFVGGTMVIAAGAQAYWGSPGGGPWAEPGWRGGPGFEPAFPGSRYSRNLDRMHTRQSTMLDHRDAMQSLGRMLSGRRAFDRAEAIGMARQIEASAGENLTRLFKSGDWRGNPLSRARVGDNMDVFKAHAEALKTAAGELADALEKQPGAEDVRASRAWSPNWTRRGRYRSFWGSRDVMPTKPVYDAYIKLRASCDGCHVNFRTSRH